jgi:hypothetical protein
MQKNFSLIYFQTKWWIKKEIVSEWGWGWACGYGYGWCFHFRTTTSVSPSYCYPHAFNITPSISGITNGIVHVKDRSISNSQDWVPSLTGTQFWLTPNPTGTKSRLAPNRTGTQSRLTPNPTGTKSRLAPNRTGTQADWYPVNWNWCIPTLILFAIYQTITSTAFYYRSRHFSLLSSSFPDRGSFNCCQR